MVDNDKTEQALLLNKMGARVVVGVYVIANIVFIALALT